MERLEMLQQRKLELNNELNQLMQTKTIQIIQKYLEVINQLNQLNKEEEHELIKLKLNLNNQILCEKEGGHVWMLLNDKYVKDENQTLHKYTCECISCGLIKEDINHKFKNIIITNLDVDETVKISPHFSQIYNSLILNKKTKQEAFEYTNSNNKIIIEEYKNINSKVK